MYYGYNEGAQQMLARYEKQVRSCPKFLAKKVLLGRNVLNNNFPKDFKLEIIENKLTFDLFWF